MKWNKYPDVKPEENKLYVVRFANKANTPGYLGYSYCGFWLSFSSGEYKFPNDKEVTHFGEISDFRKAKEMMKRPCSAELVSNVLNRKSAEELGAFFAELFTEDEMKEIILEKMSHSTFEGIADDEWDDICFEEDCRIENELWASGYYTM